jgi:hypothetical protein
VMLELEFEDSSRELRFNVCVLVGQKVIKKSLGSTRKAIDKFSRERLDSERARLKDGFIRCVDRSG